MPQLKVLKVRVFFFAPHHHPMQTFHVLPSVVVVINIVTYYDGLPNFEACFQLLCLDSTGPQLL